MSDLLINFLDLNNLSTVAILIMHSAGSPTSLCIIRSYFKCTKPFCPREGPMHSENLCIMYYDNFNCNGNTHFNINYDSLFQSNIIKYGKYDRVHDIR